MKLDLKHSLSLKLLRVVLLSALIVGLVLSCAQIVFDIYKTRQTVANDAQRILAMFSRKSADVFAAQITALLTRPDASDVLRSLQVPTLLGCGAQDSWSPPAQHQAMLQLLPPAAEGVIDVVEEAGHMAPMERPEAVAAGMLRWLQAGVSV